MARKGVEWRGKEWNKVKKGGMERRGEGGGVGNRKGGVEMLRT